MPKRRSTRRGAQPPPDRGSYTPNAGLHFDDVEFEQRLVWIWTMARSGSTWFLRTLTHPMRLQDSGKDPEDMLGFSAPPTWQGTVDAIPVDTTFLANHLLPLTSGPHYLPNGSAATFGAALGLPPKANYFFSAKYRDVWLPELRRMMLVRFHALAERTAERYETESPLIFIKEVAGAHAAPLIMSMFPRSKMIFLVRDGRDVVDSQTAANKPGGWMPVSGWKTPEDRLDFVVQRGRDWVGDVGSIQRAYEHHPDELRRMVRYEDLLAEGAGKIGPLIEWLGLNRNALWLQRTIEKNDFGAIAPEHKGEDKFYRSATPGAWRKNLTPEEGDALEAELAPTLAELGYDVGGGEGAGKSGNGVEAKEIGKDGYGTDALSSIVRGMGEGRDFSRLGDLTVAGGGPEAKRRRRIALTFDDGPVLQTEEVLQTLESRGARGTFFLVGRKVPGHEPMVRRIAAGGHEIGNHTFCHFPFPEHDDVLADSAVLEQVSGHRPRLFRPPFGSIDRPAAELAVEAGMDVILWNVDSLDGTPPWEGIPAEEVVDNVMARARPGAIVLMHDGLPWSNAVEALPEIVDRLQADGYELVTVGELLDEGDEGGESRVTGETAHDEDPHVTLEGLLTWSSAHLDPPQGGGTAAGLVTQACEHVAEGGRLASSAVFAEGIGGQESAAIRLIAVGFGVRISEREGAGNVLSDADVASLREGLSRPASLAFRLAGPTRVDRMIKERLAADADPPTVPAPSAVGPGEEFIELFSPGREVWEEIEEWARTSCRRAAELAMRELLDAAGVDPSFSLERILGVLDIDYLLRFGYVLGCCEQALALGGGVSD